MATDSKTTSSAAAGIADAGDQIAGNLAGADDIAAQRVQTLALVHQARAAQLSRSAASGRMPAAASGQTQSEAAPQAATTPELFVEVVDTKARPVFLSTTAFQPVIGCASYQNIVLPASQPPIGDPPPEIRQVAIPKA